MVLDRWHEIVGVVPDFPTPTSGDSERESTVDHPAAFGDSIFQGHGLMLLPLVAAVMAGVGLLAAIGPARRGLDIQPIEALREE